MFCRTIIFMHSSSYQMTGRLECLVQKCCFSWGSGSWAQLGTAGSWQLAGMLGWNTVVLPFLIGSASRKHQLLIPQIGIFIKKLA